jgi:uncharacterized protein YbjT (DUF2867 family)
MAEQPGSATGVNVDPLLQTVIAAENALAATWQRLNTLRREAFYGGRYNSAEYDRAVQEYRAAERSLREARSQWGRRRGLEHTGPAETAPDRRLIQAA